MAQDLHATEDTYYQKMRKLLLAADSNDHDLFRTMVNAPFHDKLRALQFDLGIIVLLLVNQKTQTIDRIALSDTYSAHGAVRMSAKPFKEIKIPIAYPENLIAQVIASGKPDSTSDWQYLFVPDLSAEDAHFNQAGAGIDCSFVYPLIGNRPGAMIFSLYQPLEKINDDHQAFMKFYSELVASKL